MWTVIESWFKQMYFGEKQLWDLLTWILIAYNDIEELLFLFHLGLRIVCDYVRKKSLSFRDTDIFTDEMTEWLGLNGMA